jgi:hypothetical protein
MLKGLFAIGLLTLNAWSAIADSSTFLDFPHSISPIPAQGEEPAATQASEVSNHGRNLADGSQPGCGASGHCAANYWYVGTGIGCCPNAYPFYSQCTNSCHDAMTTSSCYSYGGLLAFEAACASGPGTYTACMAWGNS